MPTRSQNPLGGDAWVDLVRALDLPGPLPYAADPEHQSVAPYPSTGPLWSRGATGYDYPHGGSVSNQLMLTVGDDEQGYRNVPLIVPGQENVEELIAQKKLTPAQVKKSVDWADTAGVGSFRTLAEALDYERAYHKQLEELYR
jgi:hypothetical protein